MSQSPARSQQDVGLAGASDERRKRRGMRPAGIQNSTTRMKPLAPAASLVSQAYDAILDEICDGGLPAGTHLVQEALADLLGVSRQPIQQALLLLRNDGVVQDAGRRGLLVPALDLEMMQHRYRIRAALDALAARLTAERCAASPATTASRIARCWRQTACGGSARRRTSPITRRR